MSGPSRTILTAGLARFLFAPDGDAGASRLLDCTHEQQQKEDNEQRRVLQRCNWSGARSSLHGDHVVAHQLPLNCPHLQS